MTDDNTQYDLKKLKIFFDCLADTDLVIGGISTGYITIETDNIDEFSYHHSSLIFIK